MKSSVFTQETPFKAHCSSIPLLYIQCTLSGLSTFSFLVLNSIVLHQSPFGVCINVQNERICRTESCVRCPVVDLMESRGLHVAV